VFTGLYKYFWSVAAFLSYLILQQAGEITFIAVHLRSHSQQVLSCVLHWCMANSHTADDIIQLFAIFGGKEEQPKYSPLVKNRHKAW